MSNDEDRHVIKRSSAGADSFVDDEAQNAHHAFEVDPIAFYRWRANAHITAGVTSGPGRSEGVLTRSRSNQTIASVRDSDGRDSRHEIGAKVVIAQGAIAMREISDEDLRHTTTVTVASPFRPYEPSTPGLEPLFNYNDYATTERFKVKIIERAGISYVIGATNRLGLELKPGTLIVTSYVTFAAEDNTPLSAAKFWQGYPQSQLTLVGRYVRVPWIVYSEEFLPAFTGIRIRLPFYGQDIANVRELFGKIARKVCMALEAHEQFVGNAMDVMLSAEMVVKQMPPVLRRFCGRDGAKVETALKTYLALDVMTFKLSLLPVVDTVVLTTPGSSIPTWFKGAMMLRNLLQVQFSADAGERLLARADLMTSPELGVIFRDDAVEKSFDAVIGALGTTGVEIFHVAMDVARRRTRATVPQCICGEAFARVTDLRSHGCSFERWLVASRLGHVLDGKLTLHN